MYPTKRSSGFAVVFVLLLQSIAWGQTFRIAQRVCGADGRCRTGYGTAMAIEHTRGGTNLITAAHVVRANVKPTVYVTKENRWVEATILWRHMASDVAVLHLPSKVSRVMNVAVNGPELGEQVSIYGRSGSDKNAPQHRLDGRVSAWQIIQHTRAGQPWVRAIGRSDANAFRVDIHAYGFKTGGMSGGVAVARRQGKPVIVGVMSASPVDSSSASVALPDRLQQFFRIRKSDKYAAKYRQIVDDDMFAMEPTDDTLGSRQVPTAPISGIYEPRPDPVGQTQFRGETSGPWLCRNGQRVPVSIVSGKDGRDGLDGRDGQDGHSVSPQEVATLIAQVIAANPSRFRGRDGEPFELTPQVIRQIVAAVPPKPIMLAGRQVGVWDVSAATIEIDIPVRNTPTIDVGLIESLQREVAELKTPSTEYTSQVAAIVASQLNDANAGPAPLDETAILEMVQTEMDRQIETLREELVPIFVRNSDGSMYSQDDDRKAFDPIEINLAPAKRVEPHGR